MRWLRFCPGHAHRHLDGPPAVQAAGYRDEDIVKRSPRTVADDDHVRRRVVDDGIDHRSKQLAARLRVSRPAKDD